MNRIQGALYIVVICLLFACKKEGANSGLVPGSVSIQNIAARDTLFKEMSVAKDSPVVLNLKAILNSGMAAKDHVVTFQADSSKITAYRTKYGSATLLPYGTYLFVRHQCRIPAGVNVSDSIVLNIVAQTKLKPETVYVLPVVIQNIDGSSDLVNPGQALFIVVKTGKSPVISKVGWSIVSVSSVSNATTGAELVLDTDPNSIWVSAYAAMPQNLVINFGAPVTFNAVTYSTPATYYTYGGYPTKVQIEVSDNGTTWTDKGTANAATTAVVTRQNVGLTTARYMRFTVQQAAPYVNGLSVAVVGDIGLTL